MGYEIRQAQYLMGTIIEIIVFTDDYYLKPEFITEKVFTEFERIEKIFSYFDPNSELFRINLESSFQPIEVSKEFFEVVSLAINYTNLSKEAFSIMLSPLTKLWQEASSQKKIPSKKTIKNVQKLIDPNLLDLNPTKQTVYFKKPGVSLDLSGFVKGYAVDYVKKLLVNFGVSSAFINVGNSSISCLGSPLNASCWPVAVKHLKNETIIAVLNLTDCSISTSGTNERFFTIRNNFFSNLLNAQTGYPINELTTATAICPSALQAEVISKMLLFMEQEETVEICEQNNWTVDGLLIQKLDKNNNLCLSYTDNLPITF